MAFDFTPFPTGPTAASPASKDVVMKAVKLAAADFVTGGTASVKAVLPADASIVGFEYWKQTAFSGGGVTAVTLSIGVTGTPTQFVNGFDINTPAAGTRAIFTPQTNIMAEANPDNRTDISLLFTGTATTGNPTAGSVYVLIYYVR